jgi:hypothetical protein
MDVRRQGRVTDITHGLDHLLAHIQQT